MTDTQGFGPGGQLYPMQKENFLWNGGEQLIWSLYDLVAGGCGGVTPCPRSGAEARRTPCPRGGGREELPHVRGHGRRPRVPGSDSAGAAKRSYPSPRLGAAARRSYPTSEVRGGGREEQPHFQGVVAARAQEGLEELLHVQGQEGQW